jgi:hypothetical protein
MPATTLMPLEVSSSGLDASELTRGSLWARLQYPLAAVLLAAFLLVGWQAREPTMRAAGDDELVYLALSKSLEAGSYREIFRPSAPLHVQYPPGYPAWLVVVRHTVGENLDVIRGANLVLAASALLLWFKTARQLAGVGIALPLLLLLAMNRGLLLSGSLTSEGLFLLLSTAALVWMLPPANAARRPALVAIGLAFLAFLTRSIGLALLLPVGVWLWTRRQRGTLVAWAITSLLIVGGWFAYAEIARANAASRSYASQFVGLSLQSGGQFLRLAGRLWKHFVDYATRHIPYTMSLPSIPGTLLDNLAWLVLNTVVITAGFVVFWRKWRPAALYFLIYFGFVMIWPFEDGRLLIPMIPLVLLAFLLGARWLTGLLPLRARTPVMGILVALPALGALQGASERFSRYRECDRAAPYTSPGCYDDARLTMAAGAEYLKRHAAPGAIVLTREPASINFLSGHLTEPVGVLFSGPPATALDTLRARNIQFVLVTRPWMARRLLDSCGSLQFEAEFPPDALVLSVPTGTPASDACDQLRGMARLPPPGTR